jgi:hypothetical protein
MKDENQTPYDPGVPSGPDLPGVRQYRPPRKLLVAIIIIALVLTIGIILFNIF